MSCLIKKARVMESVLQEIKKALHVILESFWKTISGLRKNCLQLVWQKKKGGGGYEFQNEINQNFI